MAFNEFTDGLPEPVRKAWERSLTSGRAAIGRRTLLRAAALTAGAGTLAACGIPAARTVGGDSTANAAKDLSDSEKVVNFSNWPLYIDTDEKDKQKHGTLDAFTAPPASRSGTTRTSTTTSSSSARSSRSSRPARTPAAT